MKTLTPAKLAAVLSKVPEKKFRIAEIAPSLMDTSGRIDTAKAISQQGEISLAVAELQAYIRGVNDMRERLKFIGGKAPDDDDFDGEDEEGIDVAEDEA